MLHVSSWIAFPYLPCISFSYDLSIIYVYLINSISKHNTRLPKKIWFYFLPYLKFYSICFQNMSKVCNYQRLTKFLQSRNVNTLCIYIELQYLRKNTHREKQRDTEWLISPSSKALIRKAIRIDDKWFIKKNHSSCILCNMFHSPIRLCSHFTELMTDDACFDQSSWDVA